MCYVTVLLTCMSSVFMFWLLWNAVSFESEIAFIRERCKITVNPTSFLYIRILEHNGHILFKKDYIIIIIINRNDYDLNTDILTFKGLVVYSTCCKIKHSEFCHSGYWWVPCDSRNKHRLFCLRFYYHWVIHNEDISPNNSLTFFDLTEHKSVLCEVRTELLCTP
jgi:hypothetical protein